jgi:signal transduction histidine kinase
MVDSKHGLGRKGRRDVLLPVIYDGEGETSSSVTETEALYAAASMPAAVADEVENTLTVLTGLSKGKEFRVRSGETWLGRDVTCEVHLEDRGVSRRHACIVRDGDAVTIRDNGAKNGTFVNERRTVEQELRSGDEIRLTHDVTLVFRSAHEVSAALVPSAPPPTRLASELPDSPAARENIAMMVAALAHELNTPLGVANTANAIIAALTAEVGKTSEVERLEDLVSDLRASTALMSKNLERANELVRSFKQLSPRESLAEIVPCELDHVVDEATTALKSEAEARHLTLRTSRPEGVSLRWVGFEQHLHTIVTHVVRNALLHAYEGREEGIVDIRLSAPDGFQLEIEDYGVGIEADRLGKIFEPFLTKERRSGALGIGLAIVRNLVKNVLQGTISVTSRVGKGTKFVIRLPRVVLPNVAIS